MTNLKGYLTTQEAATELDITIHGIIKAIQRKKIKAVKKGEGRRGVWLIERSEVERYKQERQSPGRPKRTSFELEQKV